MHPYLKIAATAFILILIFACFRRQRRYWREMHESKPTGSLRAGYKLAIATIFLSLPMAMYVNTPTAWNLFVSVLLMTVIFCVKITFSPAVIGLVLAICTYQLHVNDSFPFFEIWGAAVSVIAWRLPEEFRVFYTTLTFLWAIAILLGGGSSEVQADASDSIADVTSILPQ